MTKAHVIFVAAAMVAGCARRQEPSRFQVPAGFFVEVAAPARQAGSLIALTFDSLGRPVVSKERGHPTILIDSDGDGILETEKVFSDKVRNLQGMWFDARTLYAAGNDAAGQAGLYKLADTNNDDVADTFDRLNVFEGQIGEHGPHHIQRGPDGAPTIMLGNHTSVPADLLDPHSPARGFREYQLLPRYMDARGHAVNIMAPGGALYRIDLPARRYTLLFGGLRNAYSHAYNLEGEAFTFDSDMEWDINLPWYRAVRTVHGVAGADYGWRTGSGKFPAWYLDTLPPMNELGRSSPVGVEFYQHHVYPKEYFDALLEADWSRGRILMSTLVRSGATYRTGGEPRDFVHGEPLNVTDLAVGPDGFVYFTTGGRDTEGALYRVRYQSGFMESMFRRGQPGGMLGIVRQPQPLSSWGHAALLKAKEAMGRSWAAELEKLARDASADSRDRVQALLVMQRLGPQPSADLLGKLSSEADANVRAASVYVAGAVGAREVAAAALKDSDPFVRRRAVEALVRIGLPPDPPARAPLNELRPLLDDPDRFVRYAARVAIERLPRGEWKDLALAETIPLTAIEGLVALARTANSDAEIEPLFEKLLAIFRQKNLSTEDRLRLHRSFHIAAMTAKNGAPAPLRRQVHDLVIPLFPAVDDRLSMEYARTLAYCGQPEAIVKILRAMPRGEEKPALQIHYVYCLRAIRNGWTKQQKAILIDWFPKAAQWRGGASFPGYINLLFDSALEFFDPEEKKLAYARVPDFAPLKTITSAKGHFTPPSVVARKHGVEGVSAQEIYEFQMFDPMTLRGRPDGGRKLYENECASCHRFGGIGKDFGPDLTTISSRFQRKDLLEAILWPSRTISDQYASVIVETKGNDIINGLLVSEDSKKVVLKTAEVERPIEVPKSEIKNRRPSKISIMPDKLLDSYPMDQISDLMALLQAGAK